ncbi:hypothetical protein QJS04_geneDACA012577 [Acorus gramineus]|uniref:Uncharacterized protein n=1 Tax=Acorus gramineus TaxID=55184 RepID=A0AAV9B434_ACOGR|nr:hypothetical protein QJS04_geneDACA012577 [Acorus gramineus]
MYHEDVVSDVWNMELQERWMLWLANALRQVWEWMRGVVLGAQLISGAPMLCLTKPIYGRN